MLKPYRRVLTLPGAFAFSSTGLIARLPISMTGFGIVLLVSDRTGSYGLAGTVSAAYVLAAAAGAPGQGRVSDRFGQAAVLRVSGALYAAGIVLLLLAIESDWGAPWVHLCALVAGVATPQAGSMVRARWSHVISDRSQLNTAFALEAVIDEMVFMIGPVLVTVLTFQVAEVSGLAAAAAAAIFGTWILASLRSTEPPPSTHHDGIRPPLGWGLLGPVMFASVGLGVLFGSTEVIVVAFASELGQRGAAGLILAIWAAGSLIAGVLIGSMSLPITPLRQLRLSLLFLSLLFIPLLFLPSVIWLAFGMFLAGFMISPALIAAITLIELHVPPSRLTEGIAWTTTGLAVGVAPGAAAAGWVIDNHGASAGFWVPLIAGLGATIVVWSFRPPKVLPRDELGPR
ncbi:MAG: MFS transporter [Kineosporiaceae bacterium]|nr:MFS transporter [Aeromicrobium sp.]